MILLQVQQRTNTWITYLRGSEGTDDRSLWVNVFLTMSKYLSSVPWTHMTKEENWFLWLFSDPHMYSMTCLRKHTHIYMIHTHESNTKNRKNELIKVKDKPGWYIFYSDFDKKEINITFFIDTRFHSSYIMTTSWDLTPGSPHN